MEMTHEIIFKSYEEDPIELTAEQAKSITDHLLAGQTDDAFIIVNDELISVSTIARIRKIREVIF